MKPATSAAGVALALVAAIGFSAKAILVKLAYRLGVDAVTLLALRMAFSVPFFAVAAFWSRGRGGEPVRPRDALVLVLLGLSGYYLSSLLDFLGLQYVSAGLERLILFLYPTLTVVLSALFYHHPIGRPVRLAMVLCYAGIALVFAHDFGSLGAGVALGAALVFGSALSYAVYLVGAGRAIARLGAVRFTAWATMVACAACVAQFLLTRPLADAWVGPQVAALALAMALFSTVLPVFALSFAIRRIGSGRASLLGSVGPVSTIFLARIFLGEAITLLQLAGSALVLAGVVAIGLDRARHAAPPRQDG